MEMSVGLQNAIETSQSAINVILAAVNWQYALVHSDDILIFLETSKKHQRHIEEVLRLQNYARMTIKLMKYPFFHEIFDYLGRVLPSGELYVAHETIKALKDLQ